MTPRFLVGIALAFALVLMGGVGAVMSATSLSDRAAVANGSPIEPGVAGPVAADNPPASSSDIRAVALNSAAGAVTRAPYIVLDSDLAALAAAVKLGTASAGRVSKAVWAQEVPIAQKFLGDMCDCDQRNWLKHFIQTGQEGLSGSNQYLQSVQLLGKLRRGNSALMSAQATR